MMGIDHRFEAREETLVDMELLELPFSSASRAEVTEEEKEEEKRDELKTFVKNRLNSTPWKAYRHFTISRVPAQFREKNKALYEPAMVSIGPYYHGKKSLRTLEEHKWRFLQSFLSRKKVPVSVFLAEMRVLEPFARRCYNESVSLGPDEFSLMLLLDGCFILEYFIRLDDFDVFRVSEFNWTFESLHFDLLLLENQIPFFVIHELFNIWSGTSRDCGNRCPLCELIFGCQPFKAKLSRPQISCEKVWHLLQFYYKGIVPKTSSNPNPIRPSVVSRKEHVFTWLKSQFFRQRAVASQQKSFLGVIPCATRLHGYGVTFKKKEKPLNMFDITFKNGVLEMPYMDLNPYIRVLFRNLYAYEQNLSMSRGIFTSFTNLMDSLVNTEKDVVLLERFGIIDNMFQNEEEAAAFFNELNDFGFIHRNHHFLDLFREVQKYSESTWPRYRARLMHDYLSTPWSSISVFAAVVLLSLTVVQTVFTVYSVFHH